MAQHHTIEDTIQRARHYGEIAVDALALAPDSAIKQALIETVAFCIARAH
jgi:octaprenyl-diphosphate synthase